MIQVGQAGQGGFGGAKVTFALTGSGQVWVWGANFLTPVQISGLPPIAQISVGGTGELALDRTGALWAWGDDSYGQIGNGTTGGYTNPYKVLTGVASFSAGGYHNLAVKTDGSVWAWGYNAYGEVGNNSTANVLTPTQITGINHVTSVSAGVETSYAIKSDGTVWAWGDNSQGDLGTGTVGGTSLTPVQIPSLGAGPNTVNSHGQVRQIAGGVWGAAALLENGSVWAWGLNNTGQLGGATTAANSGIPFQIPIPNNVPQVALAGGWATYLSADESGNVTIWGAANAGQMGNNTTPAQVPPQASGYTISPFAFPWRYTTGTRDQVGDRTTTTVDADGMPVTIRPARGNDVFSTTYDTYNSYDAGNLITTSQAPVERGGAGGTGSSAASSTYSYDSYGNQTVVVSPNGFATLTDYDLANRAIDVKTTRQAGAYSGTTCGGLTGTGWTSAQQSGRVMCTTSTTYDGADQTVSVTDANAQTATSTYNGLGEKTAQTVPRNDGTYTTLTTTYSYNADGSLTDACPPRQFDAAHEQDTTSSGSCPATAAYGTHVVIDNAGRTASTTVYRVTGASSATGEATSTTYDADGNPVAVTDANGHTTTSAYNILDRKISTTVPRGPGVSYTTSWVYDPSGDVTAVIKPSGNNYGDGTTGALVVDGSTNPQSNPFVIPSGARYTTVTLQNGGWITGQSNNASTGPMGLVFTATGTVTVCSNCGITMTGQGQPGGAGASNLLGIGNGVAGAVTTGNGGGGGTSGAAGGGGGGGAHNGLGTAGANGTAGGAGGGAGATSGTSDFNDVGTNYALGSGGGGGGGAQGLNVTTASGAGGNGGGFIHITAPSISINGTITAAGANGAATAGLPTNGASGGGAGGGIWLTGETINLSASNDLSVAGGSGPASGGLGGQGGNGANGYIRIDGTVTNPPTGALTGTTAMVTAYIYDPAHRVTDTITGYQGDTTNVPGSTVVPDSLGQVNERTRYGYDPEGHKIISFTPRAFTDVNSLTHPNLDYATRSDIDADGRTSAVYSPRYDTATPTADISSGGDGGQTGVDQQSSQCATHADPSVALGYDTYPNTIGVCVARTTYDANSNVNLSYLPTSNGSDNRYTQTTWTDDNHPLSVTAPSPVANGARVTVQTDTYDADGRVVKTADANNNTNLTSYTSDGLVARIDGQSYTQGGTPLTHVTLYGYDANGERKTVQQPDYANPAAGYAAGDYITTTTWTSDGLKASVQAPGTAPANGFTAQANTTIYGGTSYNTTRYIYDGVGNPLTVSSPSATAKDVTNPDGVASVNSYTWDNLIQATSNPIVTTTNGSPTFRVTNYTYAPSGQKTAQDVGQCASATITNCVAGNSAFADVAPISYTYAPDGVNVAQIGQRNATITTAYNQAGDPTKITESDNGGVTLTASYYLDGLTRTASDGTSNSNTYAYDANGALALRTDQSPTSSGITGGGVKNTTYLYGDAGLPTNGYSDITSTNTTWNYDPAGRNLTRSDTGNGSNRQITQQFNPDNTVQFLKINEGSTVIVRNDYTYDNNGQITQDVVSGYFDGRTDTYGYNPAGNVTSFDSVVQNLFWDHNSNRTGTTATPTTYYNADNSLNKTTGTNAVNYKYLNDGDLASTTAGSSPCSSYGYDDFLRTNFQHEEQATACGTNTATLNNLYYTYDGLDRVHTTTVKNNSATTTLATTNAAYDGLSSQLVGQTQALEGNNSSSPSSTATTLYQLNPTGAPVAVNQTPTSGGTSVQSWLDKDARGNVVDLHNLGTGSSACSVKYDPFGNPIGGAPIPTGNGVCDAGASAASTANTVWYQSQSRANSYGTYQLGTRTYDPSTATFTTPDTHRVATPATDLSVGTDPLTQNTYTYVNGDPVNYSDPTGHRRLCGYTGQADDDCSSAAAKRGASLDACAANAVCSAKTRLSDLSEEAYLHNADVAAAKARAGTSFNYGKALLNFGLAMIGWDDLKGCMGGSMWDCGWTLLDLAGPAMKILGDVGKAFKIIHEIQDEAHAFDALKAADTAFLEGDKAWSVAHDADVASTAKELKAAEAASATADSGASGATLSLKYKDGWSAEQRAAADVKVASLNNAAAEGSLAVTQVERLGSAGRRYAAEGGVVPSGSDVDHVIDLQLGGSDTLENMSPLDASVNRSLGSQIGHQTRSLAPGTSIVAVSIQ